MRTLLSFLFSICLVTCFAQKENTISLGNVSLEEVKMNYYSKDSSAVALTILENGNRYYTNPKKNLFTTDYYRKTKILKNEGLELGTIELRFLKKSKINFIKGLVYNLVESDSIQKSVLSDEDIIFDDKNEYYNLYIINLPNVKVGTVFEFSYSFTDDNFTIRDWFFQKDHPVMESTFRFTRPVQMDYLINLVGPKKLSSSDRNDDVDCFPEKRKSLRCSYSNLSMLDIPAFREESLAPHPSTLISKLKFRLSYYRIIGFRPYTMMSDWTKFDKAFKKYYFDQEMTKEHFFKRIIPDSIYKYKNKLSAAKNIFHFIQNHYTWNGKETGDTQINIRRNFKNKEASVDLIASSLYNALRGAGIECYYAVVSTRSKGPIDRVYPNMRDFNYTIVKAIIDGKKYFLDATNKELGFGYVQPFASTKDVRVLDFEKGGYWEKIIQPKPTKRSSNVILKLDPQTGVKGSLTISRTGYEALDFRELINDMDQEEYLNSVENNMVDLIISDYKMSGVRDKDSPITETFSFDLENDNEVTRSIHLKPVLFNSFSEKQFDSDERIYPVNFIYPRIYNYRLDFKFPKDYKISNLPSNVNLKLPNNGGNYTYLIKSENNRIQIFISLKILKTFYAVEEYKSLKDFFQSIKSHEKSTIHLKL